MGLSTTQATAAGQSAATGDDRVPRTVWLIAAIFTAVELAVSDRFGFQQDELYFLVASHHLAGAVAAPEALRLTNACPWKR